MNKAAKGLTRRSMGLAVNIIHAQMTKLMCPQFTTAKEDKGNVACVLAVNI